MHTQKKKKKTQENKNRSQVFSNILITLATTEYLHAFQLSFMKGEG